MIEIVCATLAGIASIICAYIARNSAIRDRKAELRAEQRATESRLSMELMNANCKLSVGIAMAIKHGKCNGEVEEGLKEVEKATEAYRKFIRDIASHELTK